MGCSSCLLSRLNKIKFITQHWDNIRAPFTAGIELTPFCNLKCVHCYVESERLNPQNIMNTNDIKNIIDILVDNGLLEVFFTGGEVLTRPDFEDIYIYAKRKGLFVSVLTNGTLINQTHINMWKDFPVEVVSLTMYGYTKGTYESITNVNGSYNNFMNSIDMLRENNIPFELKFIGLTKNYHELSKMRNFSKQLGVMSTTGFDIRPMNNGNKLPLNFRVSPEDIFKFGMGEDDLYAFWENVALNEKEHQIDKKLKNGNLYPCHIGYHYVYITYDGHMQGCVKAVRHKYNLLKGTFKEGWKFLEEELVNKKASEKFPCLTCDKFYYCEQCTANFELEHNDPEIPVDFYCQLGTLRKKFIDDIRKKHKI